MVKSIIDDGFRSELVEGARFDGPYDIPVIEALPEWVSLPASLVPFDKRNQTDDYEQWVHSYLFDFRFRPLITNTSKYVEVLRRFSGFISPDPSLYRDMPIATQIANTYLNRAVGHYAQRSGIPTVANIRWSDERSFDFAFAGAPRRSMVATSNHGCLRGRENLYWFERGFDEMMCRLKPRRVILHGNLTDGLRGRYPGAEIAVYPSSFDSSRKKVA